MKKYTRDVILAICGVVLAYLQYSANDDRKRLWEYSADIDTRAELPADDVVEQAMSEDLFRTIIQGGSFAVLAYLVFYVTRVAVPMVVKSIEGLIMAFRTEQRETRETFQTALDEKDSRTDARAVRVETAIERNTEKLHENTEALHSICKYQK